MGGKKKTKWRKLPLGELSQEDDARGSSNSGSLREQTDRFTENGSSNDHNDLTNDGHAWKETRHRGYYNVGPPHFYSISTAEGHDDLNQGGTGEHDEKPGIFFNGFWIPESDLDQYNSINEPPVYEPFCPQIPVFLCPPMLPYCSTPYPHYRPGPLSDVPLFPNFGIPSDPHYYYYFTRPQTARNEADLAFEEKEENVTKPTSGRHLSENQQLTETEQSCDAADEDQPIPLTPESNADSSILYPYPGYSFGEPVYSVPIYPLLPQTQRIIPRFPWPSAQTQRKRRRKRKEYNADYAVIPAVKNSSLGSSGETGPKNNCGDLDAVRNTALNNESFNQQQKEKTPHPLPATGNGSLSLVKEQKESCVLNNQENKATAGSARLNHREETRRCIKNLAAGIVSTDNTEFPGENSQETRGNSPLIQLWGETLSESEDLIHKILTDLILKVEEQVSEENLVIQNKSENGVNDEPTQVGNTGIKFSNSKNSSHSDSKKIQCNALDQRTENLGKSNENTVNSWQCEDTPEPFKMENVLRKNQNPDFPEVHKKVHDDLREENSGSYISPKNCHNNKICDTYIQNENEKNLLKRRTAELSINEENNFFSVSLDDAEAEEDFSEEGRSWVENGNLETPVHKYESPNENEQQAKIQSDAFRVSEKHDSGNYTVAGERQHSPTKNNSVTENQGVGKFEEFETDARLVIKNRSVNDHDNESKGNTVEAKNFCGEDVLESAPSSNECSQDKDKQLYDSHRSSPHSFLSYVANSEALIRETELELSKIQHLTSRPPLQANQSIYKFAFDENLTDQSETEDTITPIPSPLLGLPNGQDRSGGSEDLAAVSAEMRQDVQKSEIIVHEGDSGSEAGSEDVELIPHRYESQCGDKHLYVNKLSLAVELLRTHEKLPYDDEFKRVVDDEIENTQCGNKGDDVNSKSRSNKTTAYVSSGAINAAFIDDSSPKIQIPVQTSPQSSLRIVDQIRALPVNHPREASDHDPEHRHSRISTADSGVQSEDSGDEIGEEAKESVYGRLGFSESEEQELWNPADDATMGYRRFGAQVRQRFNILNPRAGSLNPCFCCIIM